MRVRLRDREDELFDQVVGRHLVVLDRAAARVEVALDGAVDRGARALHAEQLVERRRALRDAPHLGDRVVVARVDSSFWVDG